MGVSIHVIGIKPPDEKFQRMMSILKQCDELGISRPLEVDNFFEGLKHPDPTGVHVDVPHRSYRGEYEEGFEVDLSSVPKDVTVLRFYMSA